MSTISKHVKSPTHVISMQRFSGNEHLKDVSQSENSRAPPVDCLLVAMPFVSVYRPSIQVGLLSAIASKAGHKLTTLHANLDFAKSVGIEEYESLCAQRTRAIGDWLFSVSAFGDDAPDHDAMFLERFADELPGNELNAERLKYIRDYEVPASIDKLVNSISPQHQVIGFTSTFQQNVASLALARALKANGHKAIMLFGGANFEGGMGAEYIRTMDMVDFAISGEADVAFSLFLDAVGRSQDPSSIAGVLSRMRLPQTDEPTYTEPVRDMDSLPVPEYSEYFEKADELGVTGSHSRRSVYMPIESSRGCWWGERKHCTFCGLNGATMKYRSKSAVKLIEEITELNERYRGFHFEAVDNILERSYIDELFPRLVRDELSFRFFFEVKSNLTREKIAVLAQGGVERVQPGIESLSSEVLSLMDKGVTAAANVNFLRWCRYYGISTGWNVLWGFPGETTAHYTEQAELFDKLHHLDPPGGVGRVWLERYSPMFRDHKRFPMSFKCPEASYAFVYPDHVDLNEIAYFFEYEFTEHDKTIDYSSIQAAAKRWTESSRTENQPSLMMWSGAGLVQIEDARDPDNVVTHTWKEPLASIYRACMNKPVSAREVATNKDIDKDVEPVKNVLDEFTQRSLMMKDHNRYLALALPARRNRNQL